MLRVYTAQSVQPNRKWCVKALLVNGRELDAVWDICPETVRTEKTGKERERGREGEEKTGRLGVRGRGRWKRK